MRRSLDLPGLRGWDPDHFAPDQGLEGLDKGNMRLNNGAMETNENK